MSENTGPVVGIVMGSESDLPIMQETQAVLDKLGIAYETRVISAHRTPERAHEFASTAEARGIKVIIAAAGKAAHLAGVIAAYTPLPIIGVPITTSDLGGLDSLLSMVQMPGGIPVATVAIGKAGAKNAGILAAQMLSLADPAVRQTVVDYRAEMAKAVEEADARVSGK
jgi:5-(carboxyamino)imidazole ribonucleotide mutase